MQLDLTYRTGTARLAWAMLGLALTGCSKINDVDVNEGALAAGSECIAQAEDPCAGACIGSICRMPCGVNRECPSKLRCVGDGDRAGCVPESFGHVDLLKDCTQGCVTPLADFGREGYFYECERRDYGPLYDLGSIVSTDTRPAIDPTAECTAVSRRVLSVKDGVARNEGDGYCTWTHLAGLSHLGAEISTVRS